MNYFNGFEIIGQISIFRYIYRNADFIFSRNRQIGFLGKIIPKSIAAVDGCEEGFVNRSCTVDRIGNGYSCYGRNAGICQPDMNTFFVAKVDARHRRSDCKQAKIGVNSLVRTIDFERESLGIGVIDECRP